MAEFQAGTAYLQVVPTLKGAQVKIAADVKRMFADGINVKVIPEVDPKSAEAKIGAFAQRMRRQIQAAISSLPDVKLGIDANTDAVTRRILQIKRELEALQNQRIGIDIDAAEAQRRVRDLTTELTRLSTKATDMQVRADTARAAEELRALDRQAGRLDGRNITLRASISGLAESIVGAAALSRALGTIALPAGIVAATPYVLSLAAALEQAAGAALLLPAGLVAGGVAAGTLTVGLGGVADTFKKLAQEDNKSAATAVSAGKARESALRSVRSARESLADAERAADRSSEQGAQRVADSRRAVAAAVEASARQVKAAQDDLARSEARARESRDALTRAYKDAREELQQLQFSVEGAGLAEEGAADRLDEARKRLADAKARGAGADEIKDLDREVRQADLDLRMAADRYSDLKAEGMEWARTGVSGSQRVVAAQRQVTEADQSVEAARAALTRAQIDGDRSVADARRDLGRTIVAVGQQQEDAARAVERATTALAEAQTAAATAGVAGTSAAAVAMGKLSPQAKALVNEVRALGPAWTSMRLDVQDRLLAGIGVRVGQLGRTYIPVLNSALGTTADGFNRATASTLDWLNTAGTTADVRTGLDNVATGTSNAAQAMKPLTVAFTDLFVVGSTFLPQLGSGVADLSTRFAGFIAHARETGQLAGWIQGGLDTLKTLGSITVNVGSIIKSTLDAARGSGESFLVTLDRFTGKIAGALRTPEGAQALQGFFTGIRIVVGLVIDKIVALWPVIAAGGGAFIALLQGAAPVTGLFLSLVSTILPPLLDALGWLSPVLGPVIAALGVGAAAMWAWNLAVSAGQLALTGYRIAVAVATALINPIATATKIWAGVQWALNAALSANPIGIVIVVLAALVAAIVLAWQHSETFRAIVTGAWGGIAAATSWLWGTVLKPIWDAFVWVLQNVVGPVVMWLWNNIIAPAFSGIGGTISGTWYGIIKPIWDALVWTIRNIIAPAALWLWNTIITPAWNGIGNIIRAVWTGVIKPAWDAIVGGLNWVGDNFNRVVGWIGDIWGRLRGLLAKPINFMIGTVWNSGIRRAWNLVAGILPGINPIGELPLIAENAQGGLYERHAAQIAPAGAMRLWAEPETGGEAYIPLAAGKRARSTSILGQVADKFGYALAPQNLAKFADGGLWRRMFGIVKGQFPAAVLTSAYRPGDPGYHGSGRATDLAGPMAAIDKWIAGAFPNSTELIHTPGINLWHGAPHTYNAQTRAEHADHVHWAMENEAMLRGLPGSYSDSGGLFNFVGDQVRKWVRDIIDPLINRLPQSPPAFAGIPRAAAVKVRDTALDWFLGQSDSAPATPGSGPVRQQVQGVATRFGWGAGRQWAALDWIINKESGWNPRAQNPRSTAYGLYQFLNGTWATVGGYKTDNPGMQAEFGNRYIQRKYRDPVGAQAFHRSHNWYDNGGWLPPGYSTVYNGTGSPEAVFNQQQLQLLRDVTTGGGGGITNHWNIYETHDPADTAAKIARRQELAVRTGAPL